jgi:hypothetical protein
VRRSCHLHLLPEVGAVAQLGERLNGIQEVRGSTPLSSTGTRLGRGPTLGWRNWQTRRIQDPVGATLCGFESHSEHFVALRSGTRSVVARSRAGGVAHVLELVDRLV